MTTLGSPVNGLCHKRRDIADSIGDAVSNFRLPDPGELGVVAISFFYPSPTKKYFKVKFVPGKTVSVSFKVRINSLAAMFNLSSPNGCSIIFRFPCVVSGLMSAGVNSRAFTTDLAVSGLARDFLTMAAMAVSAL